MQKIILLMGIVVAGSHLQIEAMFARLTTQGAKVKPGQIAKQIPSQVVLKPDKTTPSQKQESEKKESSTSSEKSTQTQVTQTSGAKVPKQKESLYSRISKRNQGGDEDAAPKRTIPAAIREWIASGKQAMASAWYKLMNSFYNIPPAGDESFSSQVGWGTGQKQIPEVSVTPVGELHKPEIMDPKFTALMEEELDKVAQGELERDVLLKDFHKTFEKDLAEFMGKDGGKKAVETEITCPQCKKHKLAIRFSKSGEFLGCTGFPECHFTSNFIRDEKGVIELKEVEAPKLLDKTCPNCGKQLRQMHGKFGDFIACSGYPECKYIERKTLPFKCPQCGSDIIERAWRGGKFWGCSGYPQCKLAIFDPVEETPCPQCKWPFLTKKTDKEGNVTLICVNKECNYKSQ